jgi:hypothetical protein
VSRLEMTLCVDVPREQVAAQDEGQIVRGGNDVLLTQDSRPATPSGERYDCQESSVVISLILSHSLLQSPALAWCTDNHVFTTVPRRKRLLAFLIYPSAVLLLSLSFFITTRTAFFLLLFNHKDCLRLYTDATQIDSPS